MRNILILPALLLGLPALISPVQAQDSAVSAGAKLGFHSERALRPEAEVWAEAGFGGFYAGTELTTVPGEEDTELDLYVGFGRELGPVLSYDLSYTRILYPFDSGDCCAEISAGVEAALTPALTAGAEVIKPTKTDGVDLSATVDFVQPLGEQFTLGLGAEASRTNGVEALDFEVSGSFSLGMTSAVTAYVEDGSNQDTEVGLNLTWTLGSDR